MKFTKTFTFALPTARVGETFKEGIDYKNPSPAAVLFAAAKGYTNDAAALAALKEAGGKTAVLKADKDARKAAAARDTARQAARAAASTAGGPDVSAAIAAATAPLTDMIETLTTEKDDAVEKLGALQSAADVVVEAHNSSEGLAEADQVETLADLASLITAPASGN